jgi:hypothetical protein
MKKVSTKTIIRLINEIFLKCHLRIILEYRLIRRMPAKPDTMYPRAIIFSSKVESNRECAAISNAPIKIPRPIVPEASIPLTPLPAQYQEECVTYLS